jgi:glucose/arabinose dehydrogenase
MKKRGLIIAICVAILLILGLIILAWPYRGFLPIFRPAPVDLSKAIPEQPVSSTELEVVRDGLNQTGLPLALPRGFYINLFAKNLNGPRSVHIAPNGVLMVAEPSAGRISALPDANKDGVADARTDIATGLHSPHDFLFFPNDGYDLYVAETDALSKMRLNGDFTQASDRSVLTKLPTGGRHVTRSLELAMAGKSEERLLISIGSSCDVCHEKDARRGTIQSVALDGSDMKLFAKGLRNSVFLEVAPDGQIWATEMGRDFLGDNLPPDEINLIEEDKNYGWPNCYGKNIHDTVFDKNTYIRNPCMEPFETPSHIDLPAHSAPLGLAFVPKNVGWPKEYEGNLLVAYHGSWNRTQPTGYAIRRFVLDETGKVVRDEDFISGWLSDKGVLGRPADLTFSKDGALYISDDKTGLIYRITPPTP